MAREPETDGTDQCDWCDGSGSVDLNGSFRSLDCPKCDETGVA